MKSIHEKIFEWQKCRPNGPLYNDIYAFIRYRTELSFSQYLPTFGPNPSFIQRLNSWLENLSNIDDQRKLFELIPRLYFLGCEEFYSLYFAAHNEIVINWLIDLYGIDIAADDLENKISTAIKDTFFCSVTDSGSPGDYIHINATSAQSDRPTWLTWAKCGDINDVLDRYNPKQIVMVEDFIGTGSQFLGTDTGNGSSVIKSLEGLNNKYSVLILPLVACQDGLDNINSVLEMHNLNSITCRAVFTLNERCFIGRHLDTNYLSTLNTDDQEYVKELHNLINKIGKDFSFTSDPFGYNGMGSLVVLYTNCSDNTVAIIHTGTEKWKPIFPRKSRE